MFQIKVIKLIYCFLPDCFVQGFHIQYKIMLAGDVGKR